MYVTFQTSGISFKPSLKEEKAVKQTSNSDQKCLEGPEFELYYAYLLKPLTP